MKVLLKILVLLWTPALLMGQSQQKKIDSLRLALQRQTNDTICMSLTDNLAFAYTESNSDSALYYYNKAAILAGKLNLKISEVTELDMKAYILSMQRNYPQSLATFLVHLGNPPPLAVVMCSGLCRMCKFDA